MIGAIVGDSDTLAKNGEAQNREARDSEVRNTPAENGGA